MYICVRARGNILYICITKYYTRLRPQENPIKTMRSFLLSNLNQTKCKHQGSLTQPKFSLQRPVMSLACACLTPHFFPHICLFNLCNPLNFTFDGHAVNVPHGYKAHSPAPGATRSCAESRLATRGRPTQRSASRTPASFASMHKIRFWA